MILSKLHLKVQTLRILLLQLMKPLEMTLLPLMEAQKIRLLQVIHPLMLQVVAQGDSKTILLPLKILVSLQLGHRRQRHLLLKARVQELLILPQVEKAINLPIVGKPQTLMTSKIPRNSRMQMKTLRLPLMERMMRNNRR